MKIPAERRGMKPLADMTKAERATFDAANALERTRHNKTVSTEDLDAIERYMSVTAKHLKIDLGMFPDPPPERPELTRLKGGASTRRLAKYAQPARATDSSRD